MPTLPSNETISEICERVIRAADSSISIPGNKDMLIGALSYRLAEIVRTAERGVLFGNDLTAEIKRIAFL